MDENSSNTTQQSHSLNKTIIPLALIIITLLSWPFLSQCGKSGVNISAQNKGKFSYTFKNNEQISVNKDSFAYQLINYLKNPFDGSSFGQNINGSNKVFTFDSIYFDSGSANINAQSNLGINNLATILKNFPQVKVKINGHTDNQGDPQSNEKLSLNRALAVKSALTNKGVKTAIEVSGLGESQPIASNENNEGRQKNRRIDLEILSF